MEHFISRLKIPFQDGKYPALFFFFLATFFLKLWFLFSSPYAFGVDGYYYAHQVQALLQRGALVSPDSSLTLYFLGLVSAVTGDVLAGIKVGAGLLSAALAFPAYRLGKTISGHPSGGLLLSILLSSSFFTLFFTFEYVKNLGGVLVFLFFLSSLAVLIKKEQWERRDILVIFIWLFLNWFTHKLTGGLSFLIFAVFFFFYQMRYPNARKALFFLTMGFVGITVAAAGFFLPNLLNWQDFTRFLSLLQKNPEFPMISLMRSQGLPGYFALELFLWMTAMVSAAIRYKKQELLKRKWICLSLIWMVLLLQPFLNLHPEKLGFRLFLLLFFPGSFLLVLFIPAQKKGLIWVLIPLLLGYQFVSLKRFSSRQPFDYELYAQILPLIQLPKDSLLIAHQGFDYFYWYYKHQKAFHFLPEEKHQNRPLFRLAYGVSPALFERVLPSEQVLFIPGRYALMTEPVWQKLLEKLSVSEKQSLLTWRNPHEYRPGYMLHNQRFRIKTKQNGEASIFFRRPTPASSK